MAALHKMNALAARGLFAACRLPGRTWSKGAFPGGGWPRAPTSIATCTCCTAADQASTAAGAGEGGVAAAAALEAAAAAGDERYMRLALQQAELAFAAGEVPVGAVLVSPAGEVLAAAHNQTEGSADPTAHAELLCIRQAAGRAGGWRLLDATLYVTLEPCPMCAGALLQSRVGTVVYGARNHLLGADGSWIAMLPQQPPEAAGESSSSSSSSSNDSGSSSKDSGSSGAEGSWSGELQDPPARPGRPHPFHPSMQVRRGVLAEDCGELMKSFFAWRRRQQAEAAAAAAAGGGGEA